MLTIERMTSNGKLVITVDAGEIHATLGGEAIPGNLQRLAAPVEHAAGRITHTLAGTVAIFAPEAETIEAALAPFSARLEIALRCDSGAFPGSAAAAKALRAELELAAFDRAHPEVIGAIRARAERISADHAAKVMEAGL